MSRQAHYMLIGQGEEGSAVENASPSPSTLLPSSTSTASTWRKRDTGKWFLSPYQRMQMTSDIGEMLTLAHVQSCTDNLNLCIFSHILHQSRENQDFKHLVDLWIAQLFNQENDASRIPLRKTWTGEQVPMTKDEIWLALEQRSPHILPQLVRNEIRESLQKKNSSGSGPRQFGSTFTPDGLRETGMTFSDWYYLPSLLIPRRTPRALFGADPYYHQRQFAQSHHSTMGTLLPLLAFSALDLRYSVHGHFFPTYNCIFNADSTLFITGGDDNLIKVWDRKSGMLVRSLRGHSSVVNVDTPTAISDMAISWDDAFLATASTDSTFVIWQIGPSLIFPGAAFTEERRFSVVARVKVPKGISTISFTRHPTQLALLVTCEENQSRIYRWNAKGEFMVDYWAVSCGTKARDKVITSSINAAGSLFATGGEDALVYIFRLPKYDPLVKSSGSPNALDRLGFGSGNPPVSGGQASDPPATAYHPIPLAPLQIHKSRINEVVFSNFPTNDLLSCSNDGLITVHTFDSELLVWELKIQLRLEGLEIFMCCWNADDTRVVSYSSDHLVRVWDWTTGRVLLSLAGHRDEGYVLRAHPTDPRIVLSASNDGLFCVWNVLAKSASTALLKKFEFPDGILGASFSSCGAHIVATDSAGHSHLFSYLDDYEGSAPPQQFFATDRNRVLSVGGELLDEHSGISPHLMPNGDVFDLADVLIQAHQVWRAAYMIQTTPPSVLQNFKGLAEQYQFLDQWGCVSNPALHVVDPSAMKIVQRTWRKKVRVDSEEAENQETAQILQATFDLDRDSGDDFIGTEDRMRSSSTDEDLSSSDEEQDSTSTSGEDSDVDTENLTFRGVRKSRQDLSSAPTKKRKRSGKENNNSKRRETRSLTKDANSIAASSSSKRRIIISDDEDGDIHESDEEEDVNSENSSGLDSDEFVESDDDGVTPDNMSEMEDDDFEEALLVAKSVKVHPKNPPESLKGKRTSLNAKNPNRSLAVLPAAPHLNEPSPWVSTHSKTQLKTYLPQIGDMVVYFKKGHEESLGSLHAYQRKHHANISAVPAVSDYRDPFCKPPSDINSDIIFGCVEDIRFSRTTPSAYPFVSCILRLHVHTISSFDFSSPSSIQVLCAEYSRNHPKYMDVELVDGYSGFVVLFSTYMQGLTTALSLKPADVVIVQSQEHGSENEATIKNILSPPGSWKSLQLAIGNSNDCNCVRNVWEVRPIMGRKSRASQKQNESTFMEDLDAGQLSAVLGIIEKAMEDERADLFADPVDYEQYPDYLDVVAYPMCLSFVQDRFQNCFYRRVESVAWDVLTIFDNAAMYNDPTSELFQLAEEFLLPLRDEILGCRVHSGRFDESIKRWIKGYEVRLRKLKQNDIILPAEKPEPSSSRRSLNGTKSKEPLKTMLKVPVSPSAMTNSSLSVSSSSTRLDKGKGKAPMVEFTKSSSNAFNQAGPSMPVKIIVKNAESSSSSSASASTSGV